MRRVACTALFPSNMPATYFCIFPAYAPSFGTFSHAFALVPGVRAFMPPQGLLIVAAYLPKRWRVRFVDENIERAVHSDFAWADVVFVSGMHISCPKSAISSAAPNRAASSLFSAVLPFPVVLRPIRSSTTSPRGNWRRD